MSDEDWALEVEAQEALTSKVSLKVPFRHVRNSLRNVNEICQGKFLRKLADNLR